MIPKRLHYVWVGGKLPDRQRAFIDTWRDTNPDYEIVQWSEDNIDLTLKPIAHAYKRQRWATVADIVRLQAVHAQGGIYLDTDFRVFRPLDALRGHSCFLAFQHEFHPTDWVCNGAFGAEAGHPFVGRALDAVLKIKPNPLGLDRVTKYGPKLFTRLIRESGLRGYSSDGVQVEDVFVCPKDVFFPFSYEEEYTDDCITSRTLAAHFWDRSWHKSIPRPVRWAHSGYRMLQRIRS